MRHAATTDCLPLLQQAAELAPADEAERSIATASQRITLSNSTGSTVNNSNSNSCGVNHTRNTSSASSSSGKGNRLQKLPGGESCSSCWEGKSSFLVHFDTDPTSTASCELVELQQQRRHPLPFQQRSVQQEPEQQQRLGGEEPQGLQEGEHEGQQAPSLCVKMQQKLQQKQLQKQRHNLAAEVDAPRDGCAMNTSDAKGKASYGRKTNSSTKGRNRSSSHRAHNSSSAVEKTNNSSYKKGSDHTDSVENEILEPTQKELQVTADYTLVSRGLVDMTYMQLEATRPPEELPPPEVGEIVESKAAHPDAQIFKARVLDRWQDPEHLWLFKLRSPDMAAPYLEPLKHVRKDSVWTLARELDIAGGRKSRRCASSLQQQHNAARSSSCAPYSSSARSTASTSGSKLSTCSSRQTSAAVCASASAPADCTAAGASKKNQSQRSAAGPTTATASSSRQQATTKAPAVAAATASGPPTEKKTSSPSLQCPVVAPGVKSTYAGEMHLTAVQGVAASSSVAVALNSSMGCSASGVPLAPTVDRCSVQAALCGPVHTPGTVAGNTVTSHSPVAVRSGAPAVTTGGVAGATSFPLLCQPPTAVDVAASFVNPTGTLGIVSGADVTDVGSLPAASCALPLACAAESPCEVPPAGAAADTGQQPPVPAGTPPPLPLVRPGVPQCSNYLQIAATAAAAKPPAATISSAAAAGSSPAALSPVAPAFEESSLFSKHFAGCSAAETPQQDTCKPLSYSSLMPELYLSPAPPPLTTAVAAVMKGKEEIGRSSPLLNSPSCAAANSTPDITSSSTENRTCRIRNADTTAPAAFGIHQLAAMERRCSSPAELSLQFMSPSVEPPKSIATGSETAVVCDSTKVSHLAPPVSFDASAGRNSWPARAELVLRDGIGLHQQRLQRLFLAAAANAAARESERKVERLAQAQHHQQQEQQQMQRQREHLLGDQDVSENSGTGGAAFLSPSPGEINGANSCCFTSPTAVSPSDTARKVEESSSSGSSTNQTSAVAALQQPTSAAGWTNTFTSTTAGAALHPLPVLQETQPHLSRQQQRQPQQQQQGHQQQGLHQEEHEQREQMVVCDRLNETELRTAHLMRPRRSLPAYQRLERMLLLKQLVPLPPRDAVPFLPFSPASITCASSLSSNCAGTAAPTATVSPAAAAVPATSASPPAGVPDALPPVAGGPGGRENGKNSPTVAAAVLEARVRAEAGATCASVGGPAAAATEQTPAPGTAEELASTVPIRSRAAAARNVAAASDVDAGVAGAADPRGSTAHKASPDTKKVRRSSNSSNSVGVGCSSGAPTDSGNNGLSSAIQAISPTQVKDEWLAGVEPHHVGLQLTGTKTFASCSCSSNSTGSKAIVDNSSLGSKTTTNGSEGVVFGSESCRTVRGSCKRNTNSDLLEKWSSTHNALNSSAIGYSRSKIGISPAKSEEVGRDSSASGSCSRKSSCGDAEWKAEDSWEARAVEEPPNHPCSLLRLGSSC